MSKLPKNIPRYYSTIVEYGLFYKKMSPKTLKQYIHALNYLYNHNLPLYRNQKATLEYLKRINPPYSISYFKNALELINEVRDKPIKCTFEHKGRCKLKGTSKIKNPVYGEICSRSLCPNAFLKLIILGNKLKTEKPTISGTVRISLKDAIDIVQKYPYLRIDEFMIAEALRNGKWKVV